MPSAGTGELTGGRIEIDRRTVGVVWPYAINATTDDDAHPPVRFVPDVGALEWKHHSEVQVRDAFQGLDDRWTCLHHVLYRVPPRMRRSMGNRDWGEADFMLLHPDFGVVGVEAKGGTYLWDAGGFRKANSNEVINPDPISQAQSTRNFVFNEVRPRLGGPFIPYALIAALPDMVVPEMFGPAGFSRNIFDRRALATGDALRKRMSEFLAAENIEWRYPSQRRAEILRAIEDTLARVTRTLPLTAQIANVVLDESAATRASFELHQDQLEVLAEQNFHRRTWTTGFAGTGKSLLAIETARSLTAQGFRVLFFTPNNLQGADVIDILGRSGQLYPGNGVPRNEADAGVHVEYLADRARSAEATLASSSRLAQSLFERFQQPCFDALVVDEFQDVTSELNAALRLLVVDEDREGSEIHVFGDPHQRSIDLGNAAEGDGFNRLPLTTVCRNSLQIHRVVSTVLPRVGRAPTMSGPEPEFISAENAEAAGAAVLAAFRRCSEREHIDVRSIQVLVGQSPDVEWGNQLIDRLREGLRGRKPAPNLPIAVDNFKGLEADVVILATGARLLDESTRRELYVGVSRARAHLVIVAPSALTHLLTPASTDSAE